MIPTNLSSTNSSYILFITIGFIIVCLILANLKKRNKTYNSDSKKHIKKIIKHQEKRIHDLEKKLNNNNIKTIEKLDNPHIPSVDVPANVSKKSVNNINEEPINDNSLDPNEGPVNMMKPSRPLISLSYPTHQPQVQLQQPLVDPVYTRDSQVLNNKLYPPIGRTERPQFDLLMNFIHQQPDLFGLQTRGPPDTYHPLGYLTPKNNTNATIDNTLILYGRSKYPNSDVGEFYVTSSNKISDIKVPILDTNSNIKRITDIPNDVKITGHMLNGDYNYTELPKADLGTSQPYI